MAFLASAALVSFSFLAAIVPAINISGSSGDPPPFPAPPGYLLPWAGGEIHEVTQGEETGFTHNGTAAYAFDFDLNYETVVASRSGKVVMVRQDSNSGGCSPAFAGSANYVVVDHGDGTSGLYLHLANASILVEVGQMVARGEPLAVSGETGVTCSDDDSAPGPHLHFQVERTEPDRYFTQSLPISFDDIPDHDGVPVEGKSYVSANYGRGKPQKIKLTPHHVERVFNPVAQPINPQLIEADHNQAPPPPTPIIEDSTAPAETPLDTPVPPIEMGWSPTPSDTPKPDDTDTPVPENTPVPANTAPPPAAVPPTAPPPTTAPPSPIPATATPPAATNTALPEASSTASAVSSAAPAVASATPTP